MAWIVSALTTEQSCVQLSGPTMMRGRPVRRAAPAERATASGWRVNSNQNSSVRSLKKRRLDSSCSTCFVMRTEESSCRLPSGFQMSSFAQRYVGGSAAASAPALCLRVSAMSFRHSSSSGLKLPHSPPRIISSDFSWESASL